MIRDILDTLAETNWRDWGRNLVDLIGVCVIVGSLTIIAIGFAPGQ